MLKKYKNYQIMLWKSKESARKLQFNKFNVEKVIVLLC